MHNRLEIAKEFAESIKSEYIIQVILFGSVARGEDNEDSDIDILIVSSNPKEIESNIDDKVLEIIVKRKEFISAHLMTEKHFFNTKNNVFLTNVLKEGVVID